MKNKIKYIKLISIFVLALVISAACVKWEEETRPSMDPASTVTLAVLSAGDSSVVVSFSNSSNGYVALNLYEGTGNEVPTELEDREAMLTGNVSSMEYYSAQTEVGTVYQVTFEGLIQDASYEVMGVANNGDGVVSVVEVLPLATADSHPPVLSSTDPEVGYSPVLPVGGPVVLYFDEPVLYDDTKDLTFSEFYAAEDGVIGSVSVEGNMVTVTPAEDFLNREIIMLSYPEGAFTDLAGNLAVEMDSYFDGGGMVGLYWRIEEKVLDAIAIAPEEEVVPTGFDIVVSFAEEVKLNDAYGDPYIADGDITLTYDDGTDVLIKSVMASEVSAAGNDLTITQSYSAPPGVEVTLDIPEGLFDIGNRNPNGEVTATWSILHPLQAWIGNYDVDAASYGAPGTWDEVWTATVAPVAGDLNSLSITIDAGGGGGVPFTVAIDDMAMTISIAPGTNAGDLYGYGPTAIYYGDYATLDEFATIVGTIAGDGTMTIDNLTMILSNYGLVDGLWDAFNTTWSPATAKKAASRGVNYVSKAARF